MLEKTAFLPFFPLYRIFLRRVIPRCQKQQFSHVLLHSRSKKFSKIHGNSFPPESLFNLQPSTSLEKRRRQILLSVSFVKFFRNSFIIENLLQTGFEKWILPKWRTDILIIIKIYRKVDSFFFFLKKHTLHIFDKAYIWEPLIESWHWT